jgi:glucosyl-dolichyl phosphate glucuronosyltransferase
MVSISVILCTYNRAKQLEKAIASLVDQSLPQSEYEVIVVDNNSTDNTKAVCSSFEGLIKNYLLVREQKQGLAAARNCGVRAARGEIVAFTDDDAQVESEWLEKFLRHFAELPPRVGIIGGEIEPIWEDKRPAWLSERWLHPLSAGLNWGSMPRFLASEEWVCEVNSAYRRVCITENGGFPENLGRIGNNLLSGENIVNEIIRSKGWSMYYDPFIRVKHSIPKERLTKEWFVRRMFWQGVTTVAADEYLSLNNIKPKPEYRVQIPTNPNDWIGIFSEDCEELDTATTLAYNLGITLASQGVISGR